MSSSYQQELSACPGRHVVSPLSTLRTLGISLAFACGFPVLAQAQNRLESIHANTLTGNKVEVTLKLSEAAPTPLTFTVDNPARIALDLPETSVAMNSRRVD